MYGTVDNGYLVGLVVRILAFTFSLGLLPAGLFPFSVRFAVAVMFFSVLAPQVEPAGLVAVLNDFFNNFFENSSKQDIGAALSWAGLLYEAAVGALLAVIVSAAMYAVLIAASAIDYVFKSDLQPSFTYRDFYSEKGGSILYTVFLLIAAVVLYSSRAFENLFILLHETLVYFPIASSDSAKAVFAAGSHAALISIVVKLGSFAFMIALNLFVPVAAALLLIDGAACIYRKYFPSGFAYQIVDSARLLMLALLLSLFIYPFAGSLASLYRDTLSAGQVQAVLEEVSRHGR